MGVPDKIDLFMGKLAECQPGLLRYVAAALALFPDDVPDVVQNTNLALIEKKTEWDAERSFSAWALGFARMKVREYLRTRKRTRIVFDTELLLAKLELAPQLPNDEETSLLKRLAVCRAKLSADGRKLLTLRYDRGKGPEEIAALLGKTSLAVRSQLLRIRRKLAQCVRNLCETGEEETDANALEDAIANALDGVGDKANALHLAAQTVEGAELWMEQFGMDALLKLASPASSVRKRGKRRWAFAASAALAFCAAASVIIPSRTKLPPQETRPNEESAMNLTKTLATAATIVAVQTANAQVIVADDFSADAVYTSEEAKTLVFDIANDVTFEGTIGGALSVVKLGEGTLTFANANTYSGGTYVSNGWLAVASPNRVGSGDLHLAGGNLRALGGLEFNSFGGSVILDEDAVFDTAVGVSTMRAAKFSGVGKTLTKTGSAEMKVTTGFSNTQLRGGRWILSEGMTSLLNDTFGSAGDHRDFTLEVRKGATVRSDNHAPLPDLVLKGGTFRSHFNINSLDNPSQTWRWKNYSFNWTVRVEDPGDGTPSTFACAAVHMGNYANTPVFTVEEGATLRMDCRLEPGRTGDATDKPLTPGGFVKKGKGKMEILQPGGLNGIVRVYEGTLAFGKNGSLGKNATLIVNPQAQVELAEGAVLDCKSAEFSLLTTADVWLDATRFSAEEGATVSSIPNFGLSGGSFDTFPAPTTGASLKQLPAPTFTLDGIGGNPSFYFNGHSGLRSTCYANNANAMTIFIVAKKTYWEDEGNKGKWGSALCMSRLASTAGDGNTYGAFYHQDNGAQDWRFQTNEFIQQSQIAVDQPWLDNITLDGTKLSMDEYIADASEPRSTSKTVKNTLNVDVTALGTRLNQLGQAEYRGDSDGNSRQFYGQIGEVLIFSRALSAEERAQINEYLKRKWLGSVDETVKSDLLLGGTVATPSGTAFTATKVDGLKKTGEGSLCVGEAGRAVEVREGTLALLPTNVIQKIGVWMDASDDSAVTLDEEGRVVSMRNKGSAGGSWQANTVTAAGSKVPPTPKRGTGIGGLPSLLFDGDSAICLESWTNRSEYGFLTVYMVAERSSSGDFAVAGKGKWSCPFSMASRNMTVGDEGWLGCFHLDELKPYPDDEAKKEVMRWNFYRGAGNANYADENNAGHVTDDLPYLFAAHLENYHYYYHFETKNDDADTGYLLNDFYKNYQPYKFDIDIVQLGCRLFNKGAAVYFGKEHGSTRCWYGKIGEFIACEPGLSDEERAAIRSYLRAKWLGKSGDSATPSPLSGTAIAGTLSAETELSVSGGATLESHASAQTVASITLSDGATLARGGAQTSGAYKMFDVAGAVSLPSSANFRAIDAPDETATIIHSSEPIERLDTSWTITPVSKRKHSIRVDGRDLVLGVAKGTVVMLM